MHLSKRIYLNSIYGVYQGVTSHAFYCKYSIFSVTLVPIMFYITPSVCVNSLNSTSI